MPQTPLSEAPHHPVTVGTVILAVVVTGASWTGNDVERLVMSPTAFLDEPWRLLTSCLPHMTFLHLLFNAMWMWRLGTVLERQFGHLVLAGLVLVCSIVATAAEFAIGGIGVGLSGVVYGLFGFLWALARFDRRHAALMDAGTVQVMLAWGRCAS
jgi:GlpG protein